jgi:hypothetical protein
MWHVLFDYPKQQLAVSFACSFHSSHVGELMQFLGRDQTLEVSPQFCRTYLAEWKPEHQAKRTAAREKATQLGLAAGSLPIAPDYEFRDGELEITSHVADFIDCVRTRALPRCHVDRAFEEAVALSMSVEAFKRNRKVRWDPVKETMVS